MDVKRGLITEEDFTTYSAIGSVHEDIDVEIDGKKYVQNKIDAWKAHKTQFSHDWWGFNIPDEYKEEFLGVESYILAFNRGNLIQNQNYSEKKLYISLHKFKKV